MTWVSRRDCGPQRGRREPGAGTVPVREAGVRCRGQRWQIQVELTPFL